MKKVLFIIWSFSMGGGAEKVLAEILNNIDTDNYEISVIEYHNFGIKQESIPKKINVLKPILVEYRGENKLLKIFNKIKVKFMRNFISYFPGIIRKMYIKDKYDVEIAFNYRIPTFLLTKKEDTKKVAWVHGVISDLEYKNIQNKVKKFKGWVDYKVQLKSFSRCDNIVAISQKTYNSIIDIYPEKKDKVIVINNGFDFNNIRRLANEKSNIYSEVSTILSLGRLDENKNQKLLLDSAKILKDKGLKFKVIFIGTGETESYLKKYSEELSLGDFVVWHGYENNPYPYIKKAQILCVTSFLEGFPTVAVEALALKTFLITTNVAGIEEISNNYKYCKIANNNAKDYAKALEEVLVEQNKYDNLAEEASYYIEKFSIETQIEELMKLINQ